MKIRMLRDDEVRVKPAVVRVYHEGQEYSVPKAIGEPFVERGSAELIQSDTKEA
ncbi:hypothetical protein AADZ90_021375 [Aestuariibius sp. 2305UL40-4]|uniref:hypothetical protein n=1 Tax=Aestuariibius violaceus TaxID=3234132 RepID=UPI00345EB7E6